MKIKRRFSVLVTLVLLFFLAGCKNNTPVYKPKKQTVILSMDDGSNSDYTILFDYLKKKEIRATSFLIGSKVNSKGFLNEKEIREMKDYGWDFQSHTYSHGKMNKLNRQELIKEVEMNNKVFEDLGLEAPIATAMPFGLRSNLSTSIFMKQTPLIRLTRHFKDRQVIYDQLTKSDLTRIHSINIDLQEGSQEKLQDIIEDINLAKEEKALIVLYFHRTFKDKTHVKYYAEFKYIRQVIQHLEDNDFDFITFKDLYNEIYHTGPQDQV